jgi:hypothetical protein
MEAAGWMKPLAIDEELGEELGHRLLRDFERISAGISSADE